MSTYTDKLKVILGVDDQMTPGVKKATSQLDGLKKAAMAVGAAFAAWQSIKHLIIPAINKAAEFHANIKALKEVTKVTGRDFAEVTAAMQSQLGGVASEAVIASGFLKGMTTELNVEQINNLTTAIRNASIAMGEDFAVQFPLIIKAIKQLNPAILDNIGVTVRLDQVNKKIRQGFYSNNREINELTQQHAIYIEIMRQTAKYQGQEATLLETSRGRMLELNASIENMAVAFGTIITQSRLFGGALDLVTSGVDALTGVFRWITPVAADLTEQHAEMKKIFSELHPEIDATTNSIKGYGSALKEISPTGFIADLDRGLEHFLAYNEGIKILETTLADEELMNALQLLAERIAEAPTEDQIVNLETWARDIKEAGDIAVTASDEAAEARKKEIAEILAARDALRQEAAALRERLALVREAMGIEIPPMIDEDVVTEEETNIASVEDYHQHSLAARERMADQFAYRATNSLRRLAQGARIEFAGMAEDFFYYFIQAALRDMAMKFVPGVLDYIAMMFDTAANDRMAMKQGEDFARYFRQGATEYLEANSMAIDITSKSRGFPIEYMPQPVMQPVPIAQNRMPYLSDFEGESSGGDIHLHFNGPVTSAEFVNNELIPAIEDASIMRRSNVKLKESNITGGPDVRVR